VNKVQEKQVFNRFLFSQPQNSLDFKIRLKGLRKAQAGRLAFVRLTAFLLVAINQGLVS